WEYAARAGTLHTYAGSDVSSEVAWHDETEDGACAHPVGKKKPNAWGLFDMGGNVWEWCSDKYLAVLLRDAVDPWGIADSRMRVVRGGAWKYYSRGMRAACRGWYKPAYRGDRHGFRVARTR
ncbi:MAG: formylglycine-generating enzyme family protein, partial [Planctomycetota bacterium]|nr:formylglycine-generating enzyme family protein [Planctomycetota bacterium]